MEGSPSNCIELKIDVTGPENILFRGASVHHSARKLLQAGTVKGLIFVIYCIIMFEMPVGVRGILVNTPALSVNPLAMHDP